LRRRRIERHRHVPPLSQRRRRAAGGGGGVRPRADDLQARRLADRRTARRAARQPHLPLQDEDGQIADAHSISAGLDYPGIGPEHSFLFDVGRAEYRSCTDDEALEAFKLCAELEGIIPALETAHALARVGELARELGKDGVIAICLSGRGDKDVATVADALGRSV
jgi:tryptophan synthase beta subunit